MNSRGCNPRKESPISSTPAGSHIILIRIPQVSPAAIHVWPLRGHSMEKIRCERSASRLELDNPRRRPKLRPTQANRDVWGALLISATYETVVTMDSSASGSGWGLCRNSNNRKSVGFSARFLFLPILQAMDLLSQQHSRADCIYLVRLQNSPKI